MRLFCSAKYQSATKKNDYLSVTHTQQTRPRVQECIAHHGINDSKFCSNYTKLFYKQTTKTARHMTA